MRSSFDIIKTGLRNSISARNLAPVGAILFLTYRCTSRCVACNLWQRPVRIEDELDWPQWQSILEQLRDAGVRDIEVYGGDALLRKELLVQVVEFCTANGITSWFPTNSSSLTEETVDQLVRAGLGTVYISLDEFPEIGGRVRGVERHFERAIRSIERFAAARDGSDRTRISCITTVSSLNYRHVNELAEAAHKFGADEYIVRGMTEFTQDAIDESIVDGVLPTPHFLPTDGQTHAFTQRQARELESTVKSLWARRADFAPMAINITNLRNLSAEQIRSLSYPHQVCAFATSQVVVSPYGHVLPCIYFSDYHLGDMKDDSLTSAWGNTAHKTFCLAQQNDEIGICSLCSNKSYHKTLGPALREATGNAREKLQRLLG